MPKKITVVKVPAGTPCPPGFNEGRTTRRGKSCFKVETVAARAPAAAVFDMSGLAAALDEVAAPVEVEVPDEQVDALMAQLGALGMGRRRKTRGKKAGRRTRRA
jgi:hypothetical protein